MVLRKICDPEVFKNQPPDRILEHFLYHSELFWAVCFTKFIQIVREGRNSKKIGKTKIENSNFGAFNGR